LPKIYKYFKEKRRKETMIANIGQVFNSLPQGQVMPERPTLSIEEAQKLASHKMPQTTFTLTEDDILKSKCNHQGNPLHPHMPAFSKNGLDQVVCNTCGEVIDLSKIYTPEEAEALFRELNNLMNILKITDRTLPDEVREQLYQATALFKKIPDIYKHCSANFDKIYSSNFVNYTYKGFNDVFGTINSMYTNNGAPAPGYANPYGQPQQFAGYPQQGQMMGQQPTGNYGFNPQPMMAQTTPMPQQNYGYVGQVPAGTNLLDPTANVYQVQQPTVPGQAPTLESVSVAGIPGATATPAIPEIDPNTGKPKTTQI
jgi:hypothetical protein